MDKIIEMMQSLGGDAFSDERVAASMAYMERLSALRKMEDDLCQGKHVILVQPGEKKRACAIKDFSQAVLKRDPRVFIPGTDALFLDGNCFVYATYNSKKQWASLNLKLVCGTLGFGLPPAPRWYEHGNPKWTSTKQFMNGHQASWDWHVWLENDDGAVYDIVPGMWHDLAAVNGKKLSIGDPTKNTLIEGLDKDHVNAHGLEYIPAPQDTQTTLFAIASHMYSAFFTEYLKLSM
jgi:hypothetical protein